MERDRQDRHETPTGVRYTPATPEHWGDGNRKYDGSLVDNRPLYKSQHVPDTVIEAIQSCGPFEDPQISKEELRPESLVEALECLTAKELAVIELVVFGGMSLREAGEWLGREFGRDTYSKQGVSNIRDSALRKLRSFYEGSTSSGNLT